MREPFLSAIPVLQKLEESGFEAYFVGGSVRDYLLKKPISDVDIATSATPEEVKGIFSKTVDVGIEHGTVLVLYYGKPYEVTTFRTEGEYQDYRRPKEVSFIRNLKEDLKRRDFTMNAIAMDRRGKIIDPFNGQQAIKEKVIQTVGTARDRFEEDALRIMRAVRFVSQLTFRIENETLLALKDHIVLLSNIAVERKRVEFEKLLTGNNRKMAIKLLIDTNLFAFLPGLRNRRQHLLLLLDYRCESLSKTEMWSLLVFCLQLDESGIVSFLRDWRLSGKEIKAIQQILVYLDKRLQQAWTVYDLYSAGTSTIESVERLYLVIKGITDTRSVLYWINQYESLPIKNRTELDVTGSDLIKWLQKKGGPWLKETLLQIEIAVLDGKLENKNQKIKEWVACSLK